MTERHTDARVLNHAVLNKYRSHVRRYLVRRLDRNQNTDDLLQDVCLRFLLVKDPQSLRKPLAYLYRIAAHVLADFRSHQARERRHLTFDSELVDEASLSICGGNRSDPCDLLDLHQQFSRAIAKLPPTHAAVVLAHKGIGFTYHEAAAKLELSVHTVEKYVTQSKALLRAM